MADYIEYWCEDPHKQTDDLPYHLQQANLHSRQDNNTVMADYVEYWCEDPYKQTDDLPYH